MDIKSAQKCLLFKRYIFIITPYISKGQSLHLIEIEFVSSVNSARRLQRKEMSFMNLCDRFTGLIVNIVRHHFECARSFSRNQEFVPFGDTISGFQTELCHTDILEEIGTFTRKHFLVGCTTAIFGGPLAQTLSLVITIPETTIEHSCKTSIPVFYLL